MPKYSDNEYLTLRLRKYLINKSKDLGLENIFFSTCAYQCFYVILSTKGVNKEESISY